MQVVLGSPAKHDAFVSRHAPFFQRLGALDEAENAAFSHALHNPSDLDKVIFYFGMRICQDFASLTLLAAHDYGLAATALLRDMYEQIVTAVHLHAHPDEVDAFLDFDAVQARKAVNRLREHIHSRRRTNSRMTQYKSVTKRSGNDLPRLLVANASEAQCRIGPKTDFATMAKAVDPLGGLIASAYDVPLAQAHATARSINSLLKVENGDVIHRTNYTDESDDAFRLGHMITMYALQLQVDHFKDSSIEHSVDLAIQDYVAIWPTTSQETAGA